MLADAPGTHRSNLLDVILLAEIASDRITETLAIWQQYAPEMCGDGFPPGHRQLLSGIPPGASQEN